MSRGAIATAALLALALVLGVVLMIGGLFGSWSSINSSTTAADCSTGTGGTQPVGNGLGGNPWADEMGGVGAASLSATQVDNARTIIGVGKTLGVPPQGWVVALATARQEAGLLNLASQANPGSIAFPHDGVAPGDHDSVGIFQQRDAWGPLAVRMDVARSAQMFYTGGQAGQRGLLDIPGWQSMSVAEAAQAVQVSAFPSAYAQWEQMAVALVEQVADSADLVSLNLGPEQAADCGVAAATGDVVYPVPKDSGYYDQQNWGNGGSNWANGHTGTDLSVACGTPVLAATAGTIQIDTTQSWSGPWLVMVSTGPGQLTTWYAHMEAIDVTQGQTVAAGQQIGRVGSEGNSTGCHLHFEVHPRGGSIYEDNINPTTWLAQHVGRDIPATVPVSNDGPARGPRAD